MSIHDMAAHAERSRITTRMGGTDVTNPASEPRDAFVILRDGERVPCLLEEIRPNEWQATPVRRLSLDEVETGGVDVLPAGASLSFLIESEDG